MEELYIKPSRLASKKAKYSTKKRKKSATLNPEERAKSKHTFQVYQSPSCKNCGEALEGDGYTSVMHCPYTDEDTYSMAPDYGPVYCDFEEE